MPDNGLTREERERMKEFLKKNGRKHISHNNEAKYYPNSKREPVKPIFIFGEKYPAPKREPGKPPKEIPENGTVPVTFSGNLYQSEAGAQDSIVMDFL